MVATTKHLAPSVWVFKHDGLRFEFTSLEAAVAYVRGFKSVSDTAKMRSLNNECRIINPARMPNPYKNCLASHQN